VLEWLTDHANDGPSWADTIDRIWTMTWMEGGRFLRLDASTGFWKELDEDAILEAIDQAMRSRLAWIRRMDEDVPEIQVVEAIEDNDFKLGRGGK
jgi:hypothetical protein